MKTIGLLVAAAAVSAAGPAPRAGAGDAFLVVRLGDLSLEEGTVPQVVHLYRSDFWRTMQALRPRAVLEGPGEAYVEPLEFRWNQESFDYREAHLAVRAPQPAGKVGGVLFVPKPDLSGMAPLRFSVAGRADPLADREAYLRVKLEHFESLMDEERPGAAWFRHQIREARRELGETVPEEGGDAAWPRRRRGSDVEQTYALVTGGLALAETLQLDRVLPPAPREPETVALESIEGIRVREFDWKALTAGLQPRTDILAALVPDDQHAVFLPTFAALLELVDHAERYGTPVLEALEPRAESARSRTRYERQMGLPLDALTRLLGPGLVSSVALTGSDPYVRTGTDVAILFQAKDPAALRTLIEGRIAVSAGAHPAARADNGEIDGVPYHGFRSPDRALCSYVATLGGAVAVTNSPVQLRRLVETFKGGRAALAGAAEYVFFRDRYPPGEGAETAFVLLTDKTIRRWCGPRWRIGTSRRTRAAAVMAEIQAEHMDRLARGDVEAGPVHTTRPLPADETLTLGPAGVSSSIHGSLGFQTPIVELDLDRVTRSEAEAYRRWRDAYEYRWRENFDPIAIRISLREGGLGLDLSVMPLILGSEYAMLVNLSSGAAIAPSATDPHPEALLHLVLALNKQSQVALGWNGMLAAAAGSVAPEIKLDPLGWLGQTASVYLDDAPLWDELAAAEDREEALENVTYRLPLAAQIEVASGIRLVAFVTAMRAFIEQSAPGMTVWENRVHNGTDYVRVGPSERAEPVEGDFEAMYYMASGDALVVSLDENVLKRVIDRRAARAAAADPQVPGPARPWLGENLCLQVEREVLGILETVYGEVYRHRMQLVAWAGIPVLNEWKQMRPARDPVEFHEAFWQRRLVCPGGGSYRWNERWQTMESTVYGHPGEPREGPTLPAPLRTATHLNAGLSFEHGGLRAHVEIGQEK